MSKLTIEIKVVGDQKPLKRTHLVQMFTYGQQIPHWMANLYMC